MQHLIDVMRRHGDRIGRDVDEIEKTIAIPFGYRASREQEAADRNFAAALGRTSPDEAQKQMMIAARSFVPEKISRFADEVIAAVRTR